MVNLKSGNLSAQQFGAKSKIQIVQGTANVEKAGSLDLQMNLSTFAAKNIESLHLDIKHSKAMVVLAFLSANLCFRDAVCICKRCSLKFKTFSRQ